MSTQLTRRTLLAGGAGLAAATTLTGAPATPAARPKYYHVSQSTINYQAEFNAGKMDMFSFMDTCRTLDLDGVDIHVGQLKSQTDRAYLKEVRRGCLNRGLPVASICVSTEYGRRPKRSRRNWTRRASPSKRECSLALRSCALSSARRPRRINGKRRFSVE